MGDHVLVIGGGGREHALVWKLAQSPLVERLTCAPGNPGIGSLAECLPLDQSPAALADWAVANRATLTVVGPEAPLAAGIADVFAARGLLLFGPSRAAAEIEWSKAFAKEFMMRWGIRTAGYASLESLPEALAYIAGQPEGPLVVKADGLAAGKGVFVAASRGEAREAARQIFGGSLGEAGRRVIIEEFLAGREVSVLAVTDGKDLVILPPAQDHKRLLAGDQGPNTGGMGAISPVPWFSAADLKTVEEKVLRPALRGLAAEGRPFRGVLYAGLMMMPDGPLVLEFNCRFGDPETEPLLRRLDSDLYPLLAAAAAGNLGDVKATWSDDAAACVVLAAGGYPGVYEKGHVIHGLTQAAAVPGVVVFQAGTAGEPVVTAGGRVLAVTARAHDQAAALARCYEAAGLIHFEGMQLRPDIGGTA
ncbi:MAG: phosphoribosylamine--glycine ligase [Symbiobacteriia bacterium]